VAKASIGSLFAVDRRSRSVQREHPSCAGGHRAERLEAKARLVPKLNSSGLLQNARRPFAAAHLMAASLSHVEIRQVAQDYTIQFNNKLYRLRADIRTDLRGATVRIEVRLDSSLAVRFRDRYLAVTECHPRSKVPGTTRIPKACRSEPEEPMDDKLPLQPRKTALSAIPAEPIR